MIDHTQRRINPRQSQFNQLIRDNFEDMLHEVIKEEEIESAEANSRKHIHRKRKYKTSSFDNSVDRSQNNDHENTIGKEE